MVILCNIINLSSRSVWMRIICWHKNKASNPHPISPMTVSVPCVWHHRTLTVSHPKGCAFLFPPLPPSIIQLSSGIQPYILCTIHLQEFFSTQIEFDVVCFGLQHTVSSRISFDMGDVISSLIFFFFFFFFLNLVFTIFNIIFF